MKKWISLIFICALMLLLSTAGASQKDNVPGEPEPLLKRVTQSTDENTRIHTRVIKGHGTVRYIETIDGETGKAEIITEFVKSDISKTASASTIPASERAALIALFQSTGGCNWTNKSNWLKSTDCSDFNDPGTECDWYGVTCNPEGTHVTGINLFNNGLSGTVGDLSGLPYLEFLSLAHNNIGGSIPTSINSLLYMDWLDLSYNNLSGTVPYLGDCIDLTHLGLGGNQLEGTIPTWLDNLPVIAYIGFRENNLTGNIPSLDNCSYLQIVDFSLNQLSGTIPAFPGSHPYFHTIRLGNNQLSGTVPDLSNLTSLDLLDVSFNQLSGEFPVWLANHSGFDSLNLSHNDFTGMIPDLLNLTALRYLYLNGNNFSGYLPRVYTLTSLQYLNLSDNRLSGNLSGEISYLTALKQLRLEGNKLKGTIPSSITNLTNLTDYSSSIAFNGLYTSDPVLNSFLVLKMGLWENSQTIPPENISFTDVTSTSLTIHWDPISFQGYDGGYKIYYTSEAMGGFYLLRTISDKSTGSYALPNSLQPGTTYSFAITSFTGPHAYNKNEILTDYSDVVSVTMAVDPEITVLNPNGGQSWALNTIKNITWDVQAVPGNVQIELRKGLILVGVIASNLDPGSGSYTWTVGELGGPVTAAPGTGYTIRVREMTGEMTYDDSDASFEITGVRLNAPNGGESWSLGSSQTVSWTAHGLSGELKLVLWKDGVQVGRIVNGLAPTSGSYSWTVGENINGTAAPGTGYTIRVRLIGQGTVDESDMAFTITN